MQNTLPITSDEEKDRLNVFGFLVGSSSDAGTLENPIILIEHKAILDMAGIVEGPQLNTGFFIEAQYLRDSKGVLIDSVQ